MSIRYLSVCSGLGGAELALLPLGAECVGVSEIDAFPSAILAERFGRNLPGEPLSGAGKQAWATTGRIQMTNWVRLWEDMPTDPKWRVISRRSGRPLPEVIAVFVFMMTNAGSNAAERGRLQNWNDEDVAAALDMDGEHVASIRDAMEGKTIDGGKLTGWERRQPKREDNSAERSKAWREAQKYVRPEQTATERARTQPNAPERNQPLDTDTDTDTEKVKETRARRASSEGPDFERFWAAWPNKVGKPQAAKAFQKVRNEIDAILIGVERYARDKPPDRPWLNPATFLNQRRWEDQPAFPIVVQKRPAAEFERRPTLDEWRASKARA